MAEAAAAAAAIAQAIKASGAIVRVEPNDFTRLVSRQDAPLVVAARGGFLRRNYHYLTSYRGFVFFTKSPEPLALSGKTEVIAAQVIWVPS
jgi:hypothetical protein